MAKNLTGPYVKYKNNPIIDFPERGGQTEDPYFFFYKNKFHCLIRDMGNYDWLSGLYLESDDGLNWGPIIVVIIKALIIYLSTKKPVMNVFKYFLEMENQNTFLTPFYVKAENTVVRY